MAKILRLKLDVTKLDKSAFFKGAKGTYADLTVFINDRPDQYDNDASVQQDLGKDRRQRGEKGPYVGNGKWSDWKAAAAAGVPQTQAAQAAPVAVDVPHTQASPLAAWETDDGVIPF